MPGIPDSNEMIDRLVAADADVETPASDSSLIELRTQLDVIESRVRRPKPADPLADEPQCRDAIERVVELGRDLSSSDATGADYFETPDDAEPVEMLGQYRLLTKLGEGGMGAVYRAVHTRLERVVALKILPKDRLQDLQAVARFQREMRAVGKLQHPNIVAAHDAGEIDGMHYLVMELVEGIDLAKLVSHQGPLAINAACELIRQAALGLQHAYQHNLVHRDIKPSNLMLAAPVDDEALPLVKVLDLGLALLEPGQIDAGDLTSTGQVMGTIDYMAPEQGNDTHGVDIRADIYSLGASLYKLLTGRAPFADVKSPMKKLMALANQTPTAVESLRPDCPPELCDLIARMLAKSPDARPAVPSEVAKALEPFARGADLASLLQPGDAAQRSTVRRGDPTVRTHATAEDPTFVPTTGSGAGSANPRRPVLISAVAAAGSFVLLAAILLYWPTGDGVVRIQIDDPEIKLSIEGHEGQITSADTQPIRLKPGNHGFEITRGDLTFEGTSLVLKRRGETRLQVQWIAGKQLRVLQDGTVLVERDAHGGESENIVAAAPSSPQLPGYELQFDGTGSSLAVLPAPFEGEGDFTVEAWVTALAFVQYGTAIGAPDVVIRLAKIGGRPNGWGYAGILAVRNEDGKSAQLAKSSLIELELGIPVHVALVRQKGATRMYVNGVNSTIKAGWGDYPDLGRMWDTPFPIKVEQWNLGGLPWNSFTGRVDEVRISSVARYEQRFTPEKRFQPDVHTLGLYHFDEGTGEILHDSSGHEHHGKIISAKWVKVGETAPQSVLENGPSQPTDRRQFNELSGAVDRAGTASQEDQRQLRERLVNYWKTHHHRDDQIQSAGLMRQLEWPADKRRRNDIPGAETAYLGREPGEGAPPELVAVYGSGRLRHWHNVRSIAFSPNSKWLATPSADGTVWIWNALSGQPIKRLQAFSETYDAAAFTPDGKSIVAVAAGGWSHRWDVDRWHLQATVEAHGGGQSKRWDRNWIAISPDAAHILCTAQNNQALIRETATGNVPHYLQGHTARVNCVDISGDGRLAVTGDESGTALLWDFVTATKVGRVTLGGGAVSAVALNSDGSLLALASSDGTLAVAKPPFEDAARLVGGLGTVVSLDFSPDGEKLLAGCGGESRGLREIGLAKGEVLRIIDQDSSWCQFARYSPDGATIACGHIDGRVGLWDAQTGASRYDPERVHNENILIAASPDGEQLIAGGYATGLRVWTTGSSDSPRALRLGMSVRSLRFVTEDQIFAAATFGVNDAGKAGIWNLTQSAWERSVIIPKSGYAPPPVLAPGSELVVSTEGAHALGVYAFSGPHRSLCRHDAPIRAFEISPDGRQVAVAVDRKVHLHNSQTGVVELSLATSGAQATCLAFAGDGTTLVCGMSEGRIHAWELPSGKALLLHAGSDHTAFHVNRIAFSPDGAQFAACSSDGAVRVWQLDSVEPIRTIFVGPPQGVIQDLIWLPDCRHLAIANQNSSAMLLRLESR